MSIKIYIHTDAEEKLKDLAKSKSFEIKTFMLANNEKNTSQIQDTTVVSFLIDYYLKNEKFPNAGVNHTKSYSSGEHYDHVSNIVSVPEAWEFFKTSKLMLHEIKNLREENKMTLAEAFEAIYDDYAGESIDSIPGMWLRKDGRVEIEQERTVTEDGCDE